MKKIIAITVMLFSIFILTACDKKDVVTNQFEQEYESLNGQKTESGKTYLDVDIPTNNLMVYATMDDLKNIFENKKSGVLYLGYPECPWCRNAVPNLIKALKRTTIDKIYYMNVHDMRDTWIYQDGKPVMTKRGTDDYYQLLKWLDPILDKYTITDDKDNEIELAEKRIYVPIVIFIKDGTIIGSHTDTVDTQTDPYKELTEEESNNLQSTYETLAHKVLGDICDESC